PRADGVRVEKSGEGHSVRRGRRVDPLERRDPDQRAVDRIGKERDTDVAPNESRAHGRRAMDHQRSADDNRRRGRQEAYDHRGQTTPWSVATVAIPLYTNF